MSNQDKSWQVLLTRIEQNIQRLNGRLAELEAQKQAVQRMVSDPEKASKPK